MTLTSLLLMASLTLSNSPKPVYEPPPAPIYHLQECPFCHNYFDSKMDEDGDYIFIKHKFVKFKVAEMVEMITCEDSYSRYIEAMATLMIQDHAGALRTTLPEKKTSKGNQINTP